jgi:hypothetical protein
VAHLPQNRERTGAAAFSNWILLFVGEQQIPWFPKVGFQDVPKSIVDCLIAKPGV